MSYVHSDSDVIEPKYEWLRMVQTINQAVGVFPAVGEILRKEAETQV